MSTERLFHAALLAAAAASLFLANWAENRSNDSRPAHRAAADYRPK